jgi:DNA repair protein RadD
MISLRPYQQDAIDSVFGYWAKGGGNPLIDMATGLGKSVVVAEINRRLVTQYPGFRVLNLVHVQELVSQNYQALIRLWPEANAGIWSAGLGKRDGHHPVTFASIQSVYKRAAQLGKRNLVLIDEAHLVPHASEGMYRKLIDDLREQAPDMRIAGLTATAYRLSSGRLDMGEGRLFDEIVYTYGVGDGIKDGWLSPLISKASLAEIDVSGVSKRGGEFVAGALEAAANDEALIRKAVTEMQVLGEHRRSWLIFCAGVKHAHHTADIMRSAGIDCATVTGDTPKGERESLIRRFKSGEIRALTNANVLTTGFDAPNVDLIAFLRPTLSTGLYVQMCGRGTRKADGKDNCLVLDFAGNVRRHGPVDAIEPPSTRGAVKKDVEAVKVDTVKAKACPDCEALLPIQARQCQWCGHTFATEAKHADTADAATPILSSEKVPPEVVPVVDWQACRWEKQGSPDSLRVTYFAGLEAINEWVCLEHGGFAGQKARDWWQSHASGPVPETVDEALLVFDQLTMPAAIVVKPNGKFKNIVGRRFNQEVAA